MGGVGEEMEVVDETPGCLSNTEIQKNKNGEMNYFKEFDEII